MSTITTSSKTGLTPLGVLALLVFAAIVVAAFAGCSAFPSIEAEHWVHDGNYGAVTTHYEASGIKRTPDGRLQVDTYSGSVKVLGGYGVSDTVKGLVIPTGSKPTVTNPTQ